MQLSYTWGMTGGFWQIASFAFYLAADPRGSGEALEPLRSPCTSWHCCGPVLIEGVNISPAWEDKPWDGSGRRPVKFVAEMATPHGAFSFWPAIILIKNNFKALLIIEGSSDLIFVPHRDRLLVIIAFCCFFYSDADRMSWALQTRGAFGKCCGSVFQLCDILSCQIRHPKINVPVTWAGIDNTCQPCVWHLG